VSFTIDQHSRPVNDGGGTVSPVRTGAMRQLVSAGCNLLVRGEKSATTATVVALSADLSAPLVVWKSETVADLPRLDCGTVVLQDVDQLGLSEQRALLAWLDDRPGHVRVISTAASDLFDLVNAGGFLDPLYYRLNTIVIDVDEASARAFAS